MRELAVHTLCVLGFTAAILAIPDSVSAQGTQVKPYMLIVFDTSGSMAWTVNGYETDGDGSQDPWGSRLCCPGDDMNSDGLPNDSRIYMVKEAMRKMVAGTGDVEFGLMKFPQRFSASSSLESSYYYGNQSAYAYDYLRYNGNSYCSTTDVDEILCVPVGPESSNDVYIWMNHTEYSGAWTVIPGEYELRAVGTTPLAWTVGRAGDYFEGTGLFSGSGVIASDPYRGCRPYFTIILSDGENAAYCGGDPVSEVQGLWDLRPGVDGSCFVDDDCPGDSTCTSGQCVYAVRSYVIGFAFSTPSTTLNNMADYGDDGILNGSASAFNASSEEELSAILADIIADSVLVEICDGEDNDCDTIADEGFTKYCDIHDVLGEGATTELIRCDDPGETQCDGLDDNCNGDVDEGLLNDCGTCGALTEICNGIDDDCDGDIDEGGVCGVCVPTGEICDNLDNDCDDDIDEGLSRNCGTNVGECSSGTQTCTAGVWGTCVGEVGPQPEACDGLDNDCDGLVDGFTEACGTDVGECEFGYRLCIDSAWSECMGGVTSTGEVCDNLDNDCDGDVDNGNPGGGAECGTDVGECDPGVITCIGGSLVCDGGTLPTAEVCNGLDDDCDGTLDNGNPEGGALCGPVALDGVGICEAGVTTCVTAGPGSATLECIGAVYPETEDCNGLDDDCNDSVDDGITGGASCGTDVGECVAGTEQCVSGSWICAGEVGPADEECNGLDDDCDGESDEGNPGGGLICGTDVGVCEPGVTLCDTTLDPPAIVCFGEVGPTDEVCNALDDDCNGIVDDGIPLGEECGISDGECEPGYYRCTEDGELECVGGVGPTDEVCDGLDNDCDTIADNEAECPVEGYICWEGYCVGPCDPDDEWPCSTGRVCEYLEEYDEFYCVGDPCEGVTCDPCTERCYGGICQNKCDGVECPPDTPLCIVDETTCTTRCIRNDCYAPGFECEEGQRCVLGECQDDPCYEVSCGTEQFCREGECVDACIAELDCAEGEMCEDGECVADPCHEVECTGGLVCDPATGTCVGDPCEGVVCPPPQVCNAETGTCYDEPCYYIECPEGFTCVEDQCVEEGLIPRPDETPEVTPDGTTDADAPMPGQDIIATGAGGCTGCTLSASADAPRGSGATGCLVLAFLLLATFVWRRRRAS